jgi:hypothetical protein
MARKRAPKKPAKAKPIFRVKKGDCKPAMNAWSVISYGLVFGAAFGVVAGALTGNYALMLPIGVALGMVFGYFYEYGATATRQSNANGRK